MSSVTKQLETYEPGNPPPDIERTTTENGQTVPFIIRIETCYQDRDQHEVAILYVAAGEGVGTDQVKCQLKPLKRSECYPLEFTSVG